jgi:TRAP transporter TAXI family solute receptor
MRKMVKRVMLLAMVVICILALTACSSAPQQQSSQQPSEGESKEPPKQQSYIYTIGTGDVGGAFYPVGSTVAKVMNDHIPGLKVTVESTGGSVDNARMVGTGDLQFGMCMGDIAYQAMTGGGKFDQAYPKVRALFATYSSISQWITLADSGINSIADFKGKKIAVGMPGSGSEVASGLVISNSGINYPDEIDPQYIGVGEGAEAVRDGHAAAAHAMGGLPQGGFLDLAETKSVKMVPVDKAAVDKIREKEPYYFAAQIPAGLYKGVDEPVDSIGVKCMVIVNEDVPEDLVYEITKACWENMDQMISGHASLKEMEPDYVAKDLPIPLHPGAEKYWEEQGLL